AFPKASLRAEQRLVDELGFDSLMVADLGGALQGAFPGLPALPPKLFNLKTTVKDLADHVVKVVTAQSAPTLDVPSAPAVRAPATRYRVVPVERRRGAFGVEEVQGQTWLVTEDGSELTTEISANLATHGADVVRVRLVEGGVSAPATLKRGTLNVWPTAFVEGLPEALERSGIQVHGFIHGAALALADAADFVNPVEVLHPLAARMQPKYLVTLTAMGGRLGLERGPNLARNVLQATLTGYTKALARERVGDRIRTLDLDPSTSPVQTAAWVVDEVLGGDLAPEVGYDGRRWVPELVPTPSGPTKRKLTREDVVLITGGAGELGRLAARWVVDQGPRAVILVGRRAATPEIDALVAGLGAGGVAVEYVAADVTDKEGFRSALRPTLERRGLVTVLLHAAGLIEDAQTPNKSLESVRRVMAVKAKGLQVLLRTFPNLRDVVLFSSWAGRFGNAGQTDYAAANELLDRVAVIGAGAARVVSIVFPPWSSTEMVRSIPAGVRAMMEGQGVTFLDDEEGLDTLASAFADGAQGIELVGRDLPARPIEAVHTERFSLGRHPYLDDHRLKGRPVVPLASVTDLVAWAFRETAGREGPLVVEDLELTRGVMGEDVARVEVSARRGHDGFTRGEIEVRVDDAVAYRARASNTVEDVPAAPILTGDAVAPAADLDTFYREQTFHGPQLRGVQRILRMTAGGVEGLVRAASISSWLTDGHRQGWTVDPLVLDGSFQLAGYWLFQHHGKAGFPTGFDRLVLSLPFGAGPIRATVTLRDVTDEGFAGDIHYADEAGRPVGMLTGIRGRFADVSAQPAKSNGAPAANLESVPDEAWQIDKFPEVEELDQRLQMAELVGLRNPYFHVHEGTARDTSVVDGVEMLNFSSYNYLGFSGHPEVVAAAQEAIARYGTSVSASRVASGERPFHGALERGLAEHVGVEDAIVFTAGHATNVTTVGHMMDRQDLVVHDSLIHDSILQGIYLSGATRRPFPHNDLEALDRMLGQVRGNYRRVLIAAEGIYSMDGDICDLPRLIEIKKRHKALLMVDEAHSGGVLGHAGRGIAHHFPGVDPNDVDIWMGTLSKSFASCGGYIAGSKALVRYLKYTGPGFVYSAGITPPNAAAALKSLELMHRHPEIVKQCRQRSLFFLERARAKGIDVGDAIGAAVVPAIIGNSLVCVKLSENLAKRKINVQPIVYPAVEDEKARLRFFISATHTEAQLAHTVDVLVEELARVRAETLGEGAGARL
ncbi:MAG: aminotransferase class I/II-fold pyridoxal phosphate-dependent enzyme, partial [Myxococcales bacterium]|nr:aminotransferase class I/II-fold pyridoxal phosphate-dependent enzyme [Myxococcales bacterium]